MSEGLTFKARVPDGRGAMVDVSVQENALDRAIRFVAPTIGEQRFKSRVRMAISGSYNGASTTRVGLRSYDPVPTDADSNTILDLPLLRSRSSDIIRNSPIGAGAINTAVTNVVGSGLSLQSTIDRDVLNLTDEEADAWEATTEREFALFAESKDATLDRSQTFYEAQDTAFRSPLERGDVFVLPPYRKRATPYGLTLQFIEADRCCNKDKAPNTDTLVEGVEKDADGAPVKYHFADRHPYQILRNRTTPTKWTVVPAYSNRAKRRQVLHLFRKLRPGQTRGVPYLAPVIETLKQLSRYTEAELQAAVVAGLFTVFIQTESGDGEIAVTPATNVTTDESKDEIKLAPGGVVGLAPGETVSAPNPGRPNAAFDPFVQSLCRYMGMALEIPKEILMKEFMASYSAARAALLEAWKFFSGRRAWLANNFCQPVYEWWMDEAVAIGRISAPGYFDDPIIRQAYLGAKWTGPSKGMIQEEQEVNAAILRMNSGISTLAEETAQLTGGDWPTNHRQSVKERKARKADGLIIDASAKTGPKPGSPDGNKPSDGSGSDLEKGNSDQEVEE